MKNIMKKCNWCNLTDEEKKWLLSDCRYWSVYLADEQDYIGRCILLSKRHLGSLPQLNMSEWLELKQIIDALEKCYQTVLGADLCNWSCLMNNFYKHSNPNPHLHIHVRPRYKKPVTIGDNTYIDTEFGHHYHPRKETQITEEDRQTLFKLMKNNLNI